MTRGFIALILILHWSQGTEGGDDVIQKPVILWEPKNGSASLSCKHNKDISYRQMYWYRQRPGETMRLIVFTVAGNDPEFGDVDKNKFEPQKSDAESGSLKVKDLDPAACLGKTVLQMPEDLLKKQDESAVITCTHNIQSYDRILWYKQSQDSLGLKLMGNLYYNNPNEEPEFKGKIKLEGEAQTNGNLTINSLRLNDSAVYFCAAYYTVLRITSV
ncbi:hypothetical protein G5714_017311 [Onychostoma macrolepis]|uniref:Ig-like domain-containing protein n=1 Tax=Onychostoma macrolepis TaxID=369639 RepID=A0A7J6C631_9TELE|nr:hypothetical protein G5714_017311 [Onychostoma macrolepis]